MKQRVGKRPPRPSFVSLDRVRLRGIGTTVTVELDRDTTDFVHLIGQKIIVDGRLETCFSVERLSHPAPWTAGERIDLLIRKAK
jgi:hypothetical protein